MHRNARHLILAALCAAGLAPATAQAQWYGGEGRQPPPLYPYELQPGQSYAVEVAPGTYVIHHPAGRGGRRDADRRAHHVARRHEAAPKPARTHADPALIKELRRRDARRTARQAAKAAKQAEKRTARHADKNAGRKPDQVINIKRIVREKPLVIVTRRVVDDPPKVITRRHYVDDLPPPARRRHVAGIAPNQAGNDNPRVIHADAEITILGPDRMSIRLVRKGGQALDADARPRKVK